MDIGLIFYAFSAGMVATVNPCGFAMLPAYVSYFVTTNEGDDGPLDGEPGGVAYRLGRALLVGWTLTVGFLLLFALAGTLISLGAYVLVTAMPWIGLLIGVA